LISLDTDDSRLRAAWETAIDLSRRQPIGWTIIGAQMVALHAFEHGRAPPRRSLDIDLLVNIRLLRDGTERTSRLLLETGFTLLDPNPFGIGHRFDNGRVQVDVLAPEGLSERASRITIPPARTVSVPGGTQALHRTELIDVVLGEQVGQIPRPNLLGAILIKARAVGVDDVPGS
jgi:hypothetical protein